MHRKSSSSAAQSHRTPVASPGRVAPGLLAAAALLLAAGAVAAVVLGPPSGPAPAQEPEVQELRNRAKALYEEQRYGEAVELFAAVAEGDSATARDRLNLALAHYQARDDDAALAALDAAGDGAAGIAGFPYLRGLVARRAGRLEEARESLERARELDATDPAIRYNLGAVYAQLGGDAAARDEFEAVIDMGFDVGLQHYVSSLYRHLQSLLREGRREEARAEAAEHALARQRLSAAQQSPSALEQSRHAEVVVPDLSLVGPTPASAERVALEEAMRLVGLPGDPAGWDVGDLDGDGLPDVVAVAAAGARVWLSGRGEAVELPEVPAGPVALGDHDRDGRPDLYVAHPGGDRLLRNVVGEASGPAPLEPVEARGLGASTDPAAVLWVDHDHDGDLDVLVAQGAGDEPVADRLLRNHGGGEFLEVTDEAGLGGATASRGALWADLDRDHDVDLYVWRAGGNALYTNQRGGRFEEIAAAVGAAGSGDTRAALTGDLDSDGDLDLVLAGPDGIELLRNTGAGTFLPAPGPRVPAGPSVQGLVAADWNNDGWLDLAAGAGDATVFLVNTGDLGFRPFDPVATGATAGQPWAAADVDGDGAVDLLAGDGSPTWLRQTGPVARWITVGLTGIKNNLRGIGSTVEVKAGGRYQMRPLRRSPLHFGLGDADRIDVVRVRWPNGIVQNLLDEAVDRRLEITELERLEGSCPFLYTWDGGRWRFVNEVLGVAPLGMPLAEGVYHTPDPDEYVPVPGEALQSRDGFLEIRLTEELREAGYVDAVRLLAVDHPGGVDVVPDERFAAPPHPEFRLFLVDRPLPVTAVDQDGRPWTGELARVDGRWAVPFEPGPYDGLATPHALTLELPTAAATPGATVRLLLTGWVYWATGSINVAADQDPRVGFTPVRLEVPDGDGGWRTAVEDIGLPNAKNSTLAVDLTGVVPAADPRVRLQTTMRLYWDAAAVTVDDGPWADGLVPGGAWRLEHGVPRAGEMLLGAAGAGAADPPVRVRVLAPAAAELRARGFSRLQRTADGYETFDYHSRLDTAPWDQHRGSYTRFGAVGELLDRADDRYVVMGTGDELAVRFADDLPAPPEGWRRDWLVYLNGWVKDGDPNTAHGDRVAPLPFHDMSGYPYGPDEAYPEDDEHRRFVETWLTRPARRINPPLIGGR